MGGVGAFLVHGRAGWCWSRTLWIGHTEAVADLYYDVANCDKEPAFIEDHYFDQGCRQPKKHEERGWFKKLRGRIRFE